MKDATEPPDEESQEKKSSPEDTKSDDPVKKEDRDGGGDDEETKKGEGNPKRVAFDAPATGEELIEVENEAIIEQFEESEMDSELTLSGKEGKIRPKSRLGNRSEKADKPDSKQFMILFIIILYIGIYL
jgi:hypothetical protein